MDAQGTCRISNRDQRTKPYLTRPSHPRYSIDSVVVETWIEVSTFVSGHGVEHGGLARLVSQIALDRCRGGQQSVVIQCLDFWNFFLRYCSLPSSDTMVPKIWSRAALAFSSLLSSVTCVKYSEVTHRKGFFPQINFFAPHDIPPEQDSETTGFRFLNDETNSKHTSSILTWSTNWQFIRV